MDGPATDGPATDDAVTDDAAGGLEPRPEPDPAVLAMIAAAVDQVWPRPVVPADETDPAHRVWRFSGRWWNKPTPMRRVRPQVGH